MGFGVFQLSLRIKIAPAIMGMLAIRDVGPGLAGFEVLVVGVEAHEVDRQLPAHDQFLQISLAVFDRRIRLLYGKRDRMRSDMAEMEIR